MERMADRSHGGRAQGPSGASKKLLIMIERQRSEWPCGQNGDIELLAGQRLPKDDGGCGGRVGQVALCGAREAVQSDHPIVRLADDVVPSNVFSEIL